MIAMLSLGVSGCGEDKRVSTFNDKFSYNTGIDGELITILKGDRTILSYAPNLYLKVSKKDGTIFSFHDYRLDFLLDKYCITNPGIDQELACLDGDDLVSRKDLQSQYLSYLSKILGKMSEENGGETK